MKARYILFAIAVLLAGCGKTPRAESFEVWGVDISRHQHNVDWQAVAERNKPHFVFVKATEGTLITDPTYDRHARELDREGILRGAYHFFGHRTPGKEQARNFIKTAKLKKGNLVPVLDIEKHRFMVEPKNSVREAKAFCKEIKRYYGVNPIIYCSSNFYESYLRRDFKPGNYTLWIADYRGNPAHLEWNFWQHTDCYNLDGIYHNVDRNVFRGTMADLQKHILR